MRSFVHRFQCLALLAMEVISGAAAMLSTGGLDTQGHFFKN